MKENRQSGLLLRSLLFCSDTRYVCVAIPDMLSHKSGYTLGWLLAAVPAAAAGRKLACAKIAAPDDNVPVLTAMRIAGHGIETAGTGGTAGARSAGAARGGWHQHC